MNAKQTPTLEQQNEQLHKWAWKMWKELKVAKELAATVIAKYEKPANPMEVVELIIKNRTEE